MVLKAGKFTFKMRAFLLHHPMVKSRKASDGERKRELN
jgi:hypothetical protein